MTQNNLSLSLLHDIEDLKSELIQWPRISSAFLKQFPELRKQLGRSFKAKTQLSLPIDLLNRYRVNSCYEGERIEILWESDEFLALNKPPGVSSHPLSFCDTHNALSFLASQGKWDALFIEEEQHEKGLLHRLDQKTSGVLLLAKKAGTHQEVRGQFQTLVKKKKYLALVCGHLDEVKTLRHELGDAGKRGEKRKIVESGEACELDVFPLVSLGGEKMLIGVHLKEGKRHQVRAQLSEVGLPILGDELYGGDSASRLFLHAYEYTWSWKGEKLEVRAESFPLLRDFLDFDRCTDMLSNTLLASEGF